MLPRLSKPLPCIDSIARKLNLSGVLFILACASCDAGLWEYKARDFLSCYAAINGSDDSILPANNCASAALVGCDLRMLRVHDSLVVRVAASRPASPEQFSQLKSQDASEAIEIRKRKTKPPVTCLFPNSLQRIWLRRAAEQRQRRADPDDVARDFFGRSTERLRRS